MIRLISAITLFFLPFSALAISEDIALDTCETPEQCITKIHEVFDRERRPGAYPSEPVQRIIKKLWSFKEDGMPFIVALLEEDNELIARIGAVALRDIDYIDEKYLPEIIKGLERDVSWLAPALARVGTPEAAEVAVKKYLVSRSAPHNQERFAIELFGLRIVPALIKAINCEYGCNADSYYLLGSALEDFAKEEKAEIAIHLVKITMDASKSIEVRGGALYVISFLGEPGKVVEKEILDLRDNEPELADAVNYTLVGIKSKHAGEIYLDILNEGAGDYILRDIAELGVNGVGAGPGVVKLLESDEPEIRVLAARTLGFIKYEKAVPKLIKSLTDSSNIQLNYVAAESLGRIKDKRAVSALEDATKNHWYPAVREAAQTAIEHIKSGTGYQNEFHKNNFAFDYFSYENMNVEMCENVALATIAEPVSQKLYNSNAKEQLEKLKYKSIILSYGASDEEQQKAENPDGIVEVNPSNIVEHREEVEQVPNIALKVTNGWLVGSNRGEWGGELVHLDTNGEQTIILEENIEDIYKLGDRHIAITGLAHLTLNSGLIYEVYQEKDGSWKSKPWLTLPGSPISSWFVESGELLINTYGGGSLLLSHTGRFRMAECK